MSNPCTDHLGNEYPSQAAMAEAYGLKNTTLDYRLKSGMPLKQALTQKKKRYTDWSALPDDATEKTGVTKRTIASRIAGGMPYDEAVSAPKMRQPKPCKDHLGIEWPTIAAMCSNYHIDPASYRNRLQNGATTEEALRWWAAEDHQGNRFKWIKDMLQYWFIEPSKYQRLEPKGVPLDQILTGWTNETMRALGISVISKIGAYWNIEYGGDQYVLNNDGLHRRMCRIAVERIMVEPTDRVHINRREDGRWGVSMDNGPYQYCLTPETAWYAVCAWQST